MSTMKLMSCFTGASHISDEVMTFLRVCFGATVLEGYGMTESSSAMSLTRADDYTTGVTCVSLCVNSAQCQLMSTPQQTGGTAGTVGVAPFVCVVLEKDCRV